MKGAEDMFTEMIEKGHPSDITFNVIIQGLIKMQSIISTKLLGMVLALAIRFGVINTLV
ncbi:hypothetical protein Sjap_008003 [Stephania japonica]|uniref:Pentatricopeptide repeat-containing protein n=1 Tax=Stephania japonica TaxID=461633 RepID=A0AAP0PBV9_9MAGN